MATEERARSDMGMIRKDERSIACSNHRRKRPDPIQIPTDPSAGNGGEHGAQAPTLPATPSLTAGIDADTRRRCRQHGWVRHPQAIPAAGTGRPVIAHTLDIFLRHPRIAGLVVIIDGEDEWWPE